MDFKFIIDENFLAFFILNREMFNESEEIKIIKETLILNNKLGYKKILEEELLESSIYLKDEKIKALINAFISTKKFEEIYLSYNNEPKEVVALKILKNIIIYSDEELENVKNELWFQFMEDYYSLLNMNSFNPTFFLEDKDVMTIINELKTKDAFKKIYEETQLYLQKVKKSWEDNKELINSYLNKVLKIDFYIEPTVYISHPNTYKGYSLENNKIVWGHYKGIEDQNYNLAYLIHEFLHCLIPFEINEAEIDANIKHCIIELISDYELYSLLKGKSTFNEGHSFLNDYKTFVYPFWLKYIGLDEIKIQERLRNDNMENVDINIINNIDLSDLNIKEFIRFCQEEYKKNMNKNTKNFK